MVLEMRQQTVVDGHTLKWMLAAGVAWLEQHREQVNNMNVFPVPDGDTGTNMLLTMRKAYQQVSELDEEHIGIVSETMARGALTGARGNSGTILSMLLRGFAQALKGQEVMDAVSFAQACQQAVDYAYDTVRSVMEPVEGTILTVARESAAYVNERVQSESNLQILLADMIKAARQSLDNTPNLLPRLREAGVVDSGGMGLVYILEGMQRIVQGKPVAEVDTALPDTASPQIESWQQAITPDDEEGYGYDVQFLMLGDNLDVAKVRADISAMGWSPLVDGDEQMVKVHIHVHNPGEPLSYAIESGAQIDDIVVENMQLQYLQYRANREQREHRNTDGVAVIAVATGDGLQAIFEDMGAARVIVGGQTMNPSTEDFVRAMKSLANRDIIILPNNGNIIMAAQQAAEMVDQHVQVLKTKTVQQGIAAMLSYGTHQAGETLEQTADAMRESVGRITTVDITIATRQVTIDEVAVQEGNFLGLVNNKIVYAGENLEKVMHATMQRAISDQHELVTLYYGANTSVEEAEAMVESLSEQFDMLEFDVIYGGQELYPYLISIE